MLANGSSPFEDPCVAAAPGRARRRETPVARHPSPSSSSSRASPHRSDLFFEILDADKSGTVTLAELSKLFTSLLPPGTEATMIKSIAEEIIASGDQSGTGSLTRDEMRAMASKLRDMFAAK